MSGIPAWCVPGAKIVCIGDFSDARAVGKRAPVINHIYTVREVDPTPSVWGRRYVRLEEIKGDLCDDGEEPSWYIPWFRPATEADKGAEVERTIFRKARRQRKSKTTQRIPEDA